MLLGILLKMIGLTRQKILKTTNKAFHLDAELPARVNSSLGGWQMKVIKVENCMGCPYLQMRRSFWEGLRNKDFSPYCMAENMIKVPMGPWRSHTIPLICPLEDLPPSQLGIQADAEDTHR